MSLTLPNLFILGYAKCGTTSLFTYLASHPDFCGSSQKEPGYFFKHKFDCNRFDLNEYAQFFQNYQYQRFVFEASVNNVYGGRCLAYYFKDKLNSPKGIILMREPVDRLYSFYRLCIDNMYISPHMSFSAYIDEAERREAVGDDLQDAPWRGYSTRYVDKVREWMDVFDEDLYIGFFEDLKTDPAGFCDSVCDWLDVEKMSTFTQAFDVENKTISPRIARLHRFARRVNKWAEPTLRRYPVVKRTARRIYQATNAAQRKAEEPTAEQRQRLNLKFGPANVELRRELHFRRPMLLLPAWLDTATD